MKIPMEDDPFLVEMVVNWGIPGIPKKIETGILEEVLRFDTHRHRG